MSRTIFLFLGNNRKDGRKKVQEKRPRSSKAIAGALAQASNRRFGSWIFLRGMKTSLSPSLAPVTRITKQSIYNYYYY